MNEVDSPEAMIELPDLKLKDLSKVRVTVEEIL